MSKEDLNIESVLEEDRIFDPPADFSESVGGSLIPSMEEYLARWTRSIEDPEGYWDEVAGEFDWSTPYEKVLEWTCPDARWFVGGRTNITDNCVDRQVRNGHGDDVAIIWEGEPVGSNGPEVIRLTYRDLQRETAKFGNVLKSLGIEKGDVVTIYMGMVPEVAIAMLACARIGAACTRSSSAASAPQRSWIGSTTPIPR